MAKRITRREALLRGTTIAGSLALAGCDKVINSEAAQAAFKKVDAFTRATQGTLLERDQLAREYAESEIAPVFYANGSTDPDDEDYKAMAKAGFKDYRLVVDGLVDKRLTLSLADLRTRPARTQITRHDCVEGWSCIGQWTGTPLAGVLDEAGLKPNARYVMFHCFDTMDSGDLSGPVPFYGTIDLQAARHPQTILAYDMRGAPLEVKYGAPLRLRVERQLGYKMNKYIKRIELIESFDQIGGGKGGYWEDSGYQWYAGI